MDDPSQWQTFTADDGRPYYYNQTTKETSWQKPACLKSPYESALEKCQWKEYTTPEGKKYYAHKTTQETVWDMPEEYKSLMNLKAQQEGNMAVDGNNGTGDYAKKLLSDPAAMAAEMQKLKQQTDEEIRNRELQQQQQPQQQQIPVQQQAPLQANPTLQQPPINSTTTATTATTTTPAATPIPTIPGVIPGVIPGGLPVPVQVPKPVAMLGRMATDGDPPTEPVEIFKRLLNDAGVPGHAVWDTALRAVVSDPRYGCINSISEKKRIFTEYCQEQRARERRDLIARKQNSKDTFTELLRKTKAIGIEVDQANSYRQAAVLLSKEDAWIAVEDDDERAFFFEDYIHSLEQAKRDAKDAERNKLIDALKDRLILLAYRDAKQEPPTQAAVDASQQKEKEQEEEKEKTSTKDEDNDKREDNDSANNRRANRVNPLDQLIHMDVDEALKEVEPPIALAFRDAIALLQDDAVLKGLEWHEKLKAHEMTVAELERRHGVWRRKKRDAQREKERRNRTAFRALLKEHKANGSISRRSTWTEFEKTIAEEPRFKAMSNQAGSQAAELFDDMIEELSEEYERDFNRFRKELQSIVRENEREAGQEVDENDKMKADIAPLPTDTVESLKSRLENADLLTRLTDVLREKSHLENCLEDVIDRAIVDTEKSLASAVRKLSRDVKTLEDALKDSAVQSLATVLGSDDRIKVVVEAALSRRRSRSPRRSHSPRRRRSRSPSRSSESESDDRRRKKHKKKSRSKRKHSDDESDSDADRRRKKRRSGSSRSSRRR